MRNKYQKLGDWHTAVGGYAPGSEDMPGWQVWAWSVLAVTVFFGAVPFVGWIAGY